MALGTFCMRGEACSDAVCDALSAGFRHIDTATCYRNEEAVADGILRSGVPRSDIFLTSKLSPKEQGYDKAVEALHGSLARLGTSYVDLYLIHWPGAAKTPHASPANKVLRTASWRALQDLYFRGLCRAIGVSNYSVQHLEELLALPPPDTPPDACQDYAGPLLAPLVNQCEAHPLLPQVPLRDFCAQHSIHFSAYSSFGQGQLLAHPAITKACEEAGTSVPDSLLKWALDCGMSVTPKSVSQQHMEANLSCLKTGAVEQLRLSPQLKNALDKLVGSGDEDCSVHESLRTAWDPTTIS
jgi:diketogulonate reductase-like aldo/keto reductase